MYKSANVYSSITDFAVFVDDIIRTVEAAQRADISADPNQTVQAFIDLCARHEDNLYKFIHEVHIHDNGLFDQLMGWIEGILEFLRKGPPGGGKLDMNGLFEQGLEAGTVDKNTAIREINSLIKWQTARKKWHHDKTRQKMAQGGDDGGDLVGMGIGGFKSSDFGLNAVSVLQCYNRIVRANVVILTFRMTLRTSILKTKMMIPTQLRTPTTTRTRSLPSVTDG